MMLDDSCPAHDKMDMIVRSTLCRARVPRLVINKGLTLNLQALDQGLIDWIKDRFAIEQAKRKSTLSPREYPINVGDWRALALECVWAAFEALPCEMIVNAFHSCGFALPLDGSKDERIRVEAYGAPVHPVPSASPTMLRPGPAEIRLFHQQKQQQLLQQEKDFDEYRDQKLLRGRQRSRRIDMDSSTLSSSSSRSTSTHPPSRARKTKRTRKSLEEASPRNEDSTRRSKRQRKPSLEKMESIENLYAVGVFVFFLKHAVICVCPNRRLIEWSVNKLCSRSMPLSLSSSVYLGARAFCSSWFNRMGCIFLCWSSK